MSFLQYRDYKDSGVEWLGEVPEHWEVIPLKHLADFVNGCAFKPDTWSTEGTPIIRIENLNGGEVFNCFDGEVDARYHIKYSDLVFGWSGNRGTSFGPFLWKKRGTYFLNQHIFKVIPFCADTQWLYWCLKAVTTHVEEQAHGIIGMVHVTKGDLGAIKVVVPCKVEQSAIAAFLDRQTAKIDALVAEQERLITLLAEKRQAVISHAVTKGLNPTAPMKDSGIEWLGEVPEHWEILRLKFIVDGNDGIQMGPFGGMLVELEGEDTGYRVYGQQNTISGDFNLGSRWIPEARFHELIRYALKPGDMVLTRKGSLGHARLLGKEISPGIIDSDTIRVRVDDSNISSTLLSLLFHEAQYIEAQINTMKRGAILSGLNTETVANLMIVLPPRQEQERLLGVIGERVNQIDLLAAQAHQAIELLKERRSALISAAVTGKIDVRGLVEAEAA